MRVLSLLVDILLAVSAPVLVAIDAARIYDPTSSAAQREATIGFVLFMPWAALLTVVAGLWLHRTDLPSPGRLLTGARPVARRSGPLADALLIVAARATALPLFHSTTLLPNVLLPTALILAILAVMSLGTGATLLWRT